MQSLISRVFYSVLAFGLMVGGLLGIVWLIAKAIDKGATILAASLASLGTVGAAAIVRYYERRKEGESARREQLGKLYEAFGAAFAGQSRPDRTIEKMLMEFRRKSLLYSSPAVIKAFTTWWREIPDEDAPESEWVGSLQLQEEMIKKMRTDLGTSNFGLDSGDLARAMHADYDAMLATAESQKVARLQPGSEQGRLGESERDSRAA